MHAEKETSKTLDLQNDSVIIRQTGSSIVSVNPIFSYDSK